MQKENPVIKNYILSSKKRILDEKTQNYDLTQNISRLSKADLHFKLFINSSDTYLYHEL